MDEPEREDPPRVGWHSPGDHSLHPVTVLPPSSEHDESAPPQ